MQSYLVPADGPPYAEEEYDMQLRSFELGNLESHIMHYAMCHYKRSENTLDDLKKIIVKTAKKDESDIRKDSHVYNVVLELFFKLLPSGDQKNFWKHVFEKNGTRCFDKVSMYQTIDMLLEKLESIGDIHIGDQIYIADQKGRRLAHLYPPNQSILPFSSVLSEKIKEAMGKARREDTNS